MRVVDVIADERAAEFSQRARAAFAADPKMYSYCDDGKSPEEGEMLALRWNRFTVMVLVVAMVEPRLYPVAEMGAGAKGRAK